MPRTFGLIVTGRADLTPMRPVAAALRAKSITAAPMCDLEGLSIADACTRVHKFVESKNIDILVLLGDRFETLCAAVVATYHRIPIAHIHGGESSFGSFDNQIRDAISKLAHIHFVSARLHANKLLSMGEEGRRIYVVGAPGLENFVDLPPRVVKKQFVITWHPETLGANDISPLIEALKEFPDYKQIWTTPNNDPGRQMPEVVTELTPKEYIKACRESAAIVGNSSSGVIEAPTLQVPSVDIGVRQDGRMKGPSVFSCPALKCEIVAAIKNALRWSGPFGNPFYMPGTSQKIADVLNTIELDGLLVKRI